MEPNCHSRRSRIRLCADVLLVCVFVATMIIPVATMGLTDADAELRRTEQRRAAPFPQLKFAAGTAGRIGMPKNDSVRKFPSEFEAWFNDHVGSRQAFIKLHNTTKVLGIATHNAGRAADRQIIVGRNGWLFYAKDRLIDDYRRTDPFRDEELAEWKKVFDARKAWLAQRGIEYVVMMAPNQQTIYTEQMPKSMNRIRSQSRFDQLQNYLAKNGGVEIIDPRPALIEGKSIHLTYFKTDTHWNEFGGFIGYQQLMNRIAERFTEAKPKKLTDYNILISSAPGLYLAVLIDSLFPYREHVVDLVPKRPPQFQLVKSVREDGVLLMESICPGAPLKNAVFLHDSFVDAMVSPFSDHFEKVSFINSFDFPADFIDREKPVVVVQEFVERHLMNIKPKNPPEVEQAFYEKTADSTPERLPVADHR